MTTYEGEDVPLPEHTPSQIGTDDSQERKDTPMARGLLDYFPAALAAVARVSKVGNDKHNPGEDMHHARGKSMDHADTIMRHLADRGSVDEHGVRHSAYAAWRALALLQQELEDAGEAPLARGARLPSMPEGGCDRYGEIVELRGEIAADAPSGKYRIVDYREPEDGETVINNCCSDLVHFVADASNLSGVKVDNPTPYGKRYIVEAA